MNYTVRVWPVDQTVEHPPVPGSDQIDSAILYALLHSTMCEDCIRVRVETDTSLSVAEFINRHNARAYLPGVV